MPVNRVRWLIFAAVLVIVVLAILGAVSRPRDGSPGGSSSPPPAPTAPAAPSAAPSPAPATPSAASAAPAATTATVAPGTVLSLTRLLDLLAVRVEDRTGYKRSLFDHWIDADGDGCDTRREVLIEEATVAPSVTAGCHLTGGRWHSSYDGLETTNSSTFDVDHVVPLAEAWDSGASAWTPNRRMRFANDLDVPWSLIAVSATSNRAKSDGDPADWLPPLVTVRCDYAADWLAVKVRWSLAIDARELAALEPLARECPDTMPVLPAP